MIYNTPSNNMDKITKAAMTNLRIAMRANGIPRRILAEIVNTRYMYTSCNGNNVMLYCSRMAPWQIAQLTGHLWSRSTSYHHTRDLIQ